MVLGTGCVSVVPGGDHSTDYPDIRVLAQHVDDHIGNIHVDRHADLSECFLDERMHGTRWFDATNIPKCSSRLTWYKSASADGRSRVTGIPLCVSAKQLP